MRTYIAIGQSVFLYFVFFFPFFSLFSLFIFKLFFSFFFPFLLFVFVPWTSVLLFKLFLLLSSRSDALQSLRIAQQHDWIDEHTRSVQLFFSLFFAPSNLFRYKTLCSDNNNNNNNKSLFQTHFGPYTQKKKIVLVYFENFLLKAPIGMLLSS